MRRMLAGASLVLTATASASLVPGCGQIDGTPRTVSPVNTCPEHPCESYEELVPGKGKPQCTAGRCEFGAGALTYPYRVVIHVPTTSESVAGLSFVVTSEDLRNTNVRASCAPPSCVRLASGEARGRYRFDADVAKAVGLGLTDVANVSVPVRVAFVPLLGSSGAGEAATFGLPLDTTFAESELQSGAPDAPPSVSYSKPLPPGRYRRYAYPQPPFDAFLPPLIWDVTVTSGLEDDVLVGAGGVQLDDPAGSSRTALVRRAEGLAGFRVWLADSATGSRISTVRRLEGTEAEARLDTIRQSAAGGVSALREGVDVVVAPPDEWVAVPRLVSTLIGGLGLRPVSYPSLPSPTRVTGLVAERTPGEASPARAVPGRVSFRSSALSQATGETTQLLRYETTVSTDASGLFSTVLPPGKYAVTLEPEPVTGRSKATLPVEIAVSQEVFTLNLEPPPRTTLLGRAALSDGRPLADAEVVASASPDPSVPRRLRPRPVRTRTRPDGTFALSLDQGAQQIAVVPQEGSGFPRVVVLADVNGETFSLPPVEIPAPVKLAFRLNNVSNAFVPIANAVVRVFAEAPGGGVVEVGRGAAGARGEVEILLAREPR